MKAAYSTQQQKRMLAGFFQLAVRCGRFITMFSTSLHQTSSAGELVVLIHGIWVNAWVMLYLQRSLHRQGFQTKGFSYSTLRKPIQDNAADLNIWLQTLKAEKIHFVAHSLGGLLLHQLFLDYPQQTTGRVVTLGSPLQGSSAARRLARTRSGRWLLGASKNKLISTPIALQQKDRDWGAIAGSRAFGIGTFLVPGLPKPSDGIVPLTETHPQWVSDYRIAPTTHTGMLFSAPIARQVVHFLREGHFLPVE